jgi:hypothetical protein
LPRWKAECVSCRGEGKRPYWSDEKRDRVLARCCVCGANFHGPGMWLPKPSLERAIELGVDPCAKCGHGHGPHVDVRQGVLL